MLYSKITAQIFEKIRMEARHLLVSSVDGLREYFRRADGFWMGWAICVFDDSLRNPYFCSILFNQHHDLTWITLTESETGGRKTSKNNSAKSIHRQYYGAVGQFRPLNVTQATTPKY